MEKNTKIVFDVVVSLVFTAFAEIVLSERFLIGLVIALITYNMIKEAD